MGQKLVNILTFLRQLFTYQSLIIILCALIGIYYQQIYETFEVQIQKVREIYYPTTQHHESLVQKAGEDLFTKQQLAKYNGEADTPIYLAILGAVYDVSKGIKHYGPNCEYHFFVGRDASVSFITGEFTKYNDESADDVLSLKQDDLLGLVNWQKFYAEQYTYKGKLLGRFYNEDGSPTKYHYKFLELVKQAELHKAKAAEYRTMFPDCNIEWSAEKGSHVWCTTSSGGIERSWVGVPRKLFQIGSTQFRCVCVQENDLSTTLVMLKTYENCDENATECFYHAD